MSTPLFDSGAYVAHLDVRIERPDGVGTALQSYRDFGGVNWIKSLRYQPCGVDQPIGQGSLVLHRQVGDVSLAPLVTASALNTDSGAYAPALDFGREIEVWSCILAPGDEPVSDSYTLAFQGITDDISWPGKTGDVTVPFRDRSGPLVDTYVRKGLTYGAPGGVDTVDVMQELLDAEMGPGQYILDDLTTGARFAVTHYKPEGVSVWQALETLAAQWGAKPVRQVYNAVAGEFRLAVVDVPRGAYTPAYEIGPSTYLEVHQITTGGRNIRTIVHGSAVDGTTGRTITSQLPPEPLVDTDPGVLTYGPRLLAFSETGEIDSQTELDAMVAGIYADVSTPSIPLEMETKYAPFAKIDDVVRWGANTVISDTHLDAAVLSLVHEFPRPGVGRTKWRCAGRPKASVLGWIRQGRPIAGLGAQVVAPPAPALVGFGPVDKDATTVTVGWERTEQTLQVWVYELLVAVPFASPPRPTSSSPRTALLAAGSDTYQIAFPKRGFEKFVYFLPVSNDGVEGVMHVSHVQPVEGLPLINVSSVMGATKLTSDVTVTVTDPKGIGGTLRAWLNRALPGDATYGVGTFDASIDFATTPLSATPGSTWNIVPSGTAAVLNEISTHPSTGKWVWLEFVNSEGISSGPQRFYLRGYGTVIEPTDELIAGSVGGTQIAAGAVDLTKVASSIRPVELYATTLPTTGTRPVGSQATITSEVPMRRYTWNGSAWTAAIPTGDLLGTLTTAQIAVGAITEALIAAGAITETKVGPAAITTPKLAAGSVTAAAIAAGTITATEIAAATITGSKIAAATITATNIAAATITATQIAADTITAAQIAAGAVNTSELAAGAITAGKLAVGFGTGMALNGDPTTSDLTAWINHAGTGVIATITDGYAGTTALRNTTGILWTARDAKRIPVEPGVKTYRLRAAIRNVSANGTAYLQVYYYDASGVFINLYNAAAAVNPGATWTVYQGTFGAGTANTIPSNAKYMQAVVALNSGGNAGYYEAQDVRLEQVLPGTLIQDGSITTAKLVANAVTANEIAAGAVTASKITVATLSAITAALGTIVSGLLQNAASSPTAAIRLDAASTLPGTATVYLDLAATGSNPVLHHSRMDLNRDGSALFSGKVKLIRSDAGTALEFLDGATTVVSVKSELNAGGNPGVLLEFSTGQKLTFASTSGGINMGADVGGVLTNISFTSDGKVIVGGTMIHDGSQLGFFSHAAASKPTVTGSRGGNAALASLLTALAGLGLLTDSSS